MKLGNALAKLLTASILGDRGPVKWCRRCSRRHRTREGCGLVAIAVPAKSGRMVQRWAHPNR